MAHYVYPANNAPSVPGYPTAMQTAFVAATPQAAAYATAPRPGQAYEAYQTQHTAPQYAYARAQVAVTGPHTVVGDATHSPQTRELWSHFIKPTTYEQKTYYQPAQAAATYSTGDAQYQQQTGVLHAVVVKPSYTTGTTYTAQRQATVPKVQTVQVTSAPTNYVYTTGASSQAVSSYQPATTYQSATTASTTTYSGYDAALYSAATSYYQQQQAAKATGTWSTIKKATMPTIGGKNGVASKPKISKPPQLHYCDVCKISCAGPQTYREHLEGQKHKKKEAAAKVGTPSSSGRSGQNQLRCELCDVTCTGTDAYAAHVRGAKHQKVLKLHTKLGKPIPSSDPVVVGAQKASSVSSVAVSKPAVAPVKAPVPTVSAPTSVAAKKVLATPKITFVGGNQLKTTGAKMEEVKITPPPVTSQTSMDSDDDDGPLNILGEKDVAPVGHEYIEEIKNDATGKIISFNCKLCECKFNDPNAKDMHMKGRRHRLQYKKKVDPSLQVEIKPSIRVRKIQEEKLRRQAAKEEFWRRKEQEQRMEEEYYWEERRRYQEMEMYEWHRMGRPGMPPPRFGPAPGIRKPDSSDDRHVMAKHASIYPNEEELQHVQNIVSACEKGLKLVSDHIAERYAIDAKAKQGIEVKKDVKVPVKPVTPAKDTKVAAATPAVPAKKDEDHKEGNFASFSSKKEDDSAAPPRVLKGVMRVGVLAKGLLLHGDLNVHLVVLCSEKPTRTLLERVADGLPKQLATCTEEKYDVKRCVEEAAIVVTNSSEPHVSCTITLTSPIMRESAEGGESSAVTVKDPPDVLDRHKCLDALAALRHAKWFQARANGLQSCVIVIRILRDLCQRVPTWTPLNEWAMELLVEKCVSSAPAPLSPGDALRRLFECIASGVLLPGGPGLLDPCEKDPMDAAAGLSNQEREDITASAQHALRLIAYRQIHKVLGMDALPVPRFSRRPFNSRKRRRTDSAQADGDGEGTAAEKKDKKEDESMN
ncbi:zinc finger RNA-binding protein-like isoform X4 [Dreissena polymorpha]|uniref:zinc finger RNA-binding protein-like isoform X4 n=1 Tax=Dreissena polymorpha TaxID=45954 RepID=UPI00226480AB|nr:zinc finger RNA-binding protein-like isoform X4 [Dreissena polymorpha]